MNVGTWNIRHARPRRGLARNRALAVSVTSLGLEILALQEAERHSMRSWFAHQARLAARVMGRTEFRYAPARRLPLVGSDGVALAVRGRIVRSETVVLPHDQHHQPRVALFAVVEPVSRSGSVSVATTHLQNHVAEAMLQLDAVLEAFAGWPAPRLLLGDLNLEPTDCGPPLAAAGFSLADGPPTVPAWQPRQRIDHVATDGLAIGRVDSPEVSVSDHRPLVAEVD